MLFAEHVILHIISYSRCRHHMSFSMSVHCHGQAVPERVLGDRVEPQEVPKKNNNREASHQVTFRLSQVNGCASVSPYQSIFEGHQRAPRIFCTAHHNSMSNVF